MTTGKGGYRPGSGRKPKEDVPSDPLPVLPAPEGLREPERAVWSELAPLAAAARTLTPETAGAMVDLCHLVTMRDRLAAAIEADGLTHVKVVVDGTGTEHHELKKHPLIGEWRAITQRIDAGRARFRLAPMGKPLPGPERAKPQSALDALKAGPIAVAR